MSIEKTFKQSGYSLLENLVAIALLLLLLTGGIQIGDRWHAKQILFKEEKRFLNFLRHARNYAVLHRVPIMICPQKNIQPDLSCPDLENWQQSLAAIQLKTTKKTTALKKVILFDPIQFPIRLHWQGFQRNRGLRFNVRHLNAASSGHFILSINAHQKKIVINRIGRIRRG